THTGDKPYHCNLCNKKFSESSDLKIHMDIHTEDNVYQCEQCDKGYACESLRTHIEEKSYKCSPCDMTFKEKCNLAKQPYDLRNKHFTGKQRLVAYQITYMGEKTYHCSLCNKTFSLKSNLDRHTSS
ncbi:unnamed protein product, partial [Meganyctiphanes norvegica]